MWFAIRLGIKVIRTAWNAVYHGFMSILGFAAGGYIYGPTQTFLIRNLVDTAFAAFGMAAYTVFLGIYVLVLGDVFRQAGGQVMEVFVIGAIVMLIATRQMLNLRTSLESGGEWVANRFALATQAAGGQGAGGGGGQALGMGAGGGAAEQLPSFKMLAAMTAMNTVAAAAANPIMAWAWPRNSTNPLVRPYKWQEGLSFQREYFDAMVQRHLTRRGWTHRGDPVSGRMMAGLADDWFDNQYPVAFLASSARSVAGVEPGKADVALWAKAMIEKYRPADAIGAPSRAWQSVYNLRNRLDAPLAEDRHPALIAASFEASGVAIRNFNRNAGQQRIGPLTALERERLDVIRRNWHTQAGLYEATVDKNWWNGLGPNARHTIARELSVDLREAHHAVRRANYSQESLDRLTRAAQRVQIVHDVARGYDSRNPFV